MHNKDINSILQNKIPELAEEIEKVYAYWKYDRTPPHVLFAEVLNQNGFMSNLLLSECNTSLIKKLFNFFEEMAFCDDEEVRNLLQVTILEYLWGDINLLNRAHKYMHPETRRLSDELQIYFNPG